MVWGILTPIKLGPRMTPIGFMGAMVAVTQTPNLWTNLHHQLDTLQNEANK